MKFLDLFAGVGGIRLGMEQAGHTCVGFCEIDKFARQSYKAIHNIEGETEYHDITKVTDEQWSQFRGTVDVICGGFPCQSFSLAGKRQGFLDETRGTLFFEIARAAKQIKPRILFLENVKGLLSHDKGKTFGTILNTLDELGYDAEWQVLNSKNFGVPQNRERVFVIGHLRGDSGREVFPIRREDGETNGSNEIKVIGNTSNTGYRSHDVLDSTGISTTLMSRDYKDPKQVAIKQVGNLTPDGSFGGNPQTGRVYDPDGISPTLSTMQGGGLEPKIAIREATKKGYAEATAGDSVNISQPNSKTRRGRVGKQLANTLETSLNQGVVIPVLTPDRVNKRQNGRRFKEDGDPEFTLTAQDRHGILTNVNQGVKVEAKPAFGRFGQQAADTMNANEVSDFDIIEPFNHRVHKNQVSPTLTTRPEGLKTAILPVTNNLRIRKLTPRECWRLQGFPDWAFDKAQEAGLSNSQLYKQAGNSVTVPVIKAIAERLSEEKNNE